MGAIHDNIKFHSNRNDQTQNSKPVLQEKKMNQENCQPNPTSLSSNNKNEIFATVKFDSKGIAFMRGISGEDIRQPRKRIREHLEPLQANTDFEEVMEVL